LPPLVQSKQRRGQAPLPDLFLLIVPTLPDLFIPTDLFISDLFISDGKRRSKS
jgi:hypothetical protein